MKILVTGGTGSLGTSLKKVFPNAFFPSRSEMDITDARIVEEAVLAYSPDVLVHTAAFVDVRGCEEDKLRAWKTNVEGTQNIVSAVSKLNDGCYLVYLSTACVFAGENERYYTEDDVPSPKNFYGLTKMCGEVAVRQYKNSCIIRTNFVPRQKWKYPKAFVDRFGTYLFSDQVAQGISEVLQKKEKGTIHIVGDRRISMYELAKLAGSKDVGELTLEEYKGPPLTIDMSLSTRRWKQYKIL